MPEARLLAEAVQQRAAAQGNTYWMEKLTSGAPLRLHMAVMVEPYLSRVLDGSKTVESRFSRKKIAPWKRVAPGDAVLLKKSGGPFMAIFEVSRALYRELDGGELLRLREAYGPALQVEDSFWREKSVCSFATLLAVSHLFVFSPFSIPFPNRRSWVDFCSPPEEIDIADAETPGD